MLSPPIQLSTKRLFVFCDTFGLFGNKANKNKEGSPPTKQLCLLRLGLLLPMLKAIRQRELLVTGLHFDLKACIV